MVDPLARVEPAARPILAMVDRAIGTLGAPPVHPVWGMLRSVAALPAAAVAAVAAWDPAPLRNAAQILRGRARAYLDAPVGRPTSWRGMAASAYTAHAMSLARHLNVGPDSMAHRLAETAGYADAVADFYEQSRSGLAEVLAEVLASRQAVTLRSPSSGVLTTVTAAADIAARVLAVVAEIVATGEHLPDSWRERVDEVGFRPPSEADPGPPTIDVHH